MESTLKTGYTDTERIFATGRRKSKGQNTAHFLIFRKMNMPQLMKPMTDNRKPCSRIAEYRLCVEFYGLFLIAHQQIGLSEKIFLITTKK